MKYSINYLKRIKNKKTSGKVSNVFSAFIDNSDSIQGFKFEQTTFVRKVPKKKKNIEKIKRRFNFLKKYRDSGRTLNLKRLRRYIKFSNELGEPVPEDITNKFNELLNVSEKSKEKKIKKQKNRKRKPVKYDAYIKSPLWTKRRNSYYKIHGRFCEICKSTKFIELHHMYYGNYGDEKNEHLVPLCKEHHDKFHRELGKTKKDMIKETRIFIEKEIKLLVN